MNASEKAEKIATLKAALAAVESEPTGEELAEAREFLAKQRASAGDKPPQAEPDAEAARAAAGVAAVAALTAPAASPRRFTHAELVAQAVEAGLASVRAREAKP